MATVGWSQDRIDEVLVPVIRDMNQKQAEGTQSNITHFFDGGTGAGAFAPRKRAEGKSKRMERAMVSLHEQALRKRGGGREEGDEEGEVEENGEREVELEPKRKRAKRSKPRIKRKARETAEEEDDGYRDEDEDAVVETAKRRKTGGRKSTRKN